jgi:ankyrin repeat protein
MNMYKWIFIAIGFLFALGVNPVLSQEDLPEYDLLFAADTGGVKQVRVALLEGANVNYRSSEGITALMYAASNGHLDVVEVLIENNADVNAKPYYSNQTALYSAVLNGHVEIAELLIRNSAEMNIKDTYGAGLLHLASSLYSWEMVDLLIYYGADINALDDDERTPLFYAAFWDNAANIHVLIENHADIEHADSEGNTALHVASIRGSLNVVKELVKENANANAKNEMNFTPLDLAALKGHKEVVDFLLNGYSTIQDSISRGVNTLSLARKGRNSEIIRLLKENGAKPNRIPYFNSVGMSFFFNTNVEDVFLGGAVSIHEDKYNFDVDVRIAKRSNRTQVLVLNEPGSEWYFYEDRSYAGAGVIKTFDFYQPPSGWRYGLSLAAHQYVSWYSLIGQSVTPAPDFFQGYQAGFSVKYDMFRFGVNYEWMGIPIKDYAKSRINFDFRLYLRFRDDMYYNVIL